jgi:lipopolysaccharide biosynthesis glycosyltransferase
MMYSAKLSNTRGDVTFGLANINGLLSTENLNLAKNFCRQINIDLECIDIQTNLTPKLASNYSIATFSRLILMDQLSEPFVWLDADLLLMPGWNEIFSVQGDSEKNETAIRACKDLPRTLELLKKRNNMAYLAAGDRYFNAGVLWIDPKVWQNRTSPEIWHNLVANMEEYKFSHNDQDILNYLMKNFVSLIPNTFNTISGSGTRFGSQPYIKHFAGLPKPWKMDQSAKEFILASQGANYFRPEHRIMSLPESFIELLDYWKVEDALLAHFELLNPEFHHSLVMIKAQMTSSSLSRIQKIKHSLIMFASRKIRPNWDEVESL